MCLRLGDSSKVTWLSQTTRTPAWTYCIPGTTACLRRLPGSQESWTEGDMRKGDLNSSIPQCQETKTVRLFNPLILQVRHAKPWAPGLNLSNILPGLGVPWVGGALGSFSAAPAQLLLIAIPSWPQRYRLWVGPLWVSPCTWGQDIIAHPLCMDLITNIALCVPTASNKGLILVASQMDRVVLSQPLCPLGGWRGSLRSALHAPVKVRPRSASRGVCVGGGWVGAQ